MNLKKNWLLAVSIAAVVGGLMALPRPTQESKIEGCNVLIGFQSPNLSEINCQTRSGKPGTGYMTTFRDSGPPLVSEASVSVEGSVLSVEYLISTTEGWTGVTETIDISASQRKQIIDYAGEDIIFEDKIDLKTRESGGVKTVSVSMDGFL